MNFHFPSKIVSSLFIFSLFFFHSHLLKPNTKSLANTNLDTKSLLDTKSHLLGSALPPMWDFLARISLLLMSVLPPTWNFSAPIQILSYPQCGTFRREFVFRYKITFVREHFTSNVELFDANRDFSMRIRIKVQSRFC